MAHILKPQRTTFDLSRIDPKYRWYWRHLSWYYPLWDWGSGVVRHVGPPRKNSDGTLLADVSWGRRGNWWGPEAEGGGTNPPTKRIDIPHLLTLTRGGGNKWTLWTAFILDNTSGDDRVLWGNAGSRLDNQASFRVDAGTSPQGLELVVDQTPIASSNNGTIAINTPYLATVSHNGTTDAGNHTFYAVNLNTQQFTDDGGTASSNHNEVSPETYTNSLMQRIGTPGDDPMDGIVMAAGCMAHEITRSEVAMLARDIYGPIRQRDRVVVKPPAVTTAALSATISESDTADGNLIQCYVSPADSWNNFAFTTQTGSYRATWTDTPGASPMQGTVHLGDQTVASFNNAAVQIALFSTGGAQWKAWDGNVDDWDNDVVISYSADTPVALRVDVDITNATFTAYADGVVFATDYAFKDEQSDDTDADNWAIRHESAGGSSHKVCDFQVEKVALLRATITDSDTVSADAALLSKMSVTVADDDAVSADLDRSFAVAATITDDDAVTADAALSSKVSSTIADDDAVTADAALASKVSATIADDDAVTADAVLTAKVSSTITDDDAVTADLTVGEIALAATITDSDAVSADAALASKVSATIADDDAVTADLDRAFSVSATIADDDTVTADLTVTGADAVLAATITDSDAVSADAVLTAKVSATIADDDAVSADAALASKVSATITDDDAVTADLDRSFAVAATIADDDAVSADAALASKITVTIADDDAVTADAALASKITVTITDDDTVTADAALASKITVTIADDDAVTADLIITGAVAVLAATIREVDPRTAWISTGRIGDTRTSTFIG